ncbi:MAG: hypothetical protein RL446_380, partial [Pseudomonadota bacterium]
MLPLIRSMAFVMFQAISVSIWGTLFIL